MKNQILEVERKNLTPILKHTPYLAKNLGGNNVWDKYKKEGMTQFLMKNPRDYGGEPLKQDTNGEYMKQETNKEYEHQGGIL